MTKIESYYENVKMPDSRFRIKSFTSSCLENCITVHPHWHNEIEILSVVSGSATQQVNDRIFTIGQGDIIIIGRNQLHSTYSHQGETCEIHILMMDESGFFGRDIPEQDCPELFENEMVFSNPILSAEEPGSLLQTCIMDILGELAAHRQGYQLVVKSQFYKFSAILVRSKLYRIESYDSRALQFSRNMLENTFRLIDESYDGEISIHTAASASNISDSHFCRLFKETTGMTFKTYLNFYRVNKAEIMLQEDENVTETALDCGFGSVSSFVRNFKKFKNCTPSALKSDSKKN